jgi:hypothetical protein
MRAGESWWRAGGELVECRWRYAGQTVKPARWSVVEGLPQRTHGLFKTGNSGTATPARRAVTGEGDSCFCCESTVASGLEEQQATTAATLSSARERCVVTAWERAGRTGQTDGQDRRTMVVWW